ncbi:hypothetical protein O6H91_01G105400 [Diphasiastrum complanatum]|uniref:Uncharacterized protein n=2 Tax=Diphasiastrum complanatum TaxID=34168 RepID=A0ACC2EU74_DIPCM|nr:hypothetical protein O6H91_01G104100 [Diphasiastrum complanatum]KAJ7570057.1 hypothetical protein O6H91_01G105400 [Diphasiastrum complanatum]
MAHHPPSTMVIALIFGLLLLAFLQESRANTDAIFNSKGVMRHLLQDSSKSATFDCASKCDYRCSKAKLHKRCIHYCNMCCGKCNCVPSGTSGNKQECPCYDEMKNSDGGPKCP